MNTTVDHETSVPSTNPQPATFTHPSIHLPADPFPAFSRALAYQLIEPERLNKFFAPFSEELAAAGISFPDHESANGSYYNSVSAALASPDQLPAPLCIALLTLEKAATLDNSNRLDDAIHRRIRCVNLHNRCPIDCALELWFRAPDELSQFQPPATIGEFPLTDSLTPRIAPKSDEVGSITTAAAPALPLPEGPQNAERSSLDGHLTGGGVGNALGRVRGTGNGFEVGSSRLEIQSSPSSPAPSTLNSPTIHSTAPTLESSAEADRQSLSDPDFKVQSSMFKVQSSAAPNSQPSTPQLSTSAAPWPDRVDGKVLLDELAAVLRRYVVLPAWAAEALALWIVHTFAFQLRDVSTYIGIESPEKRCGKTTLLTLVSQLVNRPVVASNISPPAFFRVIEEVQPTLLIDEADTFLRGNDELRGILNAGNKRETAFVVRVANQSFGPGSSRRKEAHSDSPDAPAPPPSTINSPALNRPSQLASFSSWCPKMMAAIGHLPETLADRCIVIRMQRKTPQESCERLRNLDAEPLRRKCARFVADHGAAIAAAQPDLPVLNDRAADIWEPLLAIADLAGGHWPDLARQAAVAITSRAQDQSPIGSLLLDLFVIFALDETDRHFTRSLVAQLSHLTDRPWNEMRKGKQITEAWLSQCLRPYGVRSRTMRIGTQQAKGFFRVDLMEVFRRYLPKSELQALLTDQTPADLPRQSDATAGPPPPANPPDVCNSLTQ